MIHDGEEDAEDNIKSLEECRTRSRKRKYIFNDPLATITTTTTITKHALWISQSIWVMKTRCLKKTTQKIIFSKWYFARNLSLQKISQSLIS